MVIDYSRFDGIGESSSEDEQDNDDDESGRVPVYKLQGPGDEFISSGGARVRVAPRTKNEEDDGTSTMKATTAAAQPTPTCVPRPALRAASDDNATVPGTSTYCGDSLETMSRNGAVRERYAWSQDKAEVVVSFFVDKQTRARDVQMSVEASSRRLVMRVRGAVSFDGVLAYPVKGSLFGGAVLDASGGEEHEQGADWEVRDVLASASSQRDGDDRGRRAVRLTLRKEVPGAGMIVWWSKVFAEGDGSDDAPIDTTTIAARKPAGGAHGRDAMAKAWAEAHDVFASRVGDMQKERELIPQLIAQQHQQQQQQQQQQRGEEG